MISAPIRVFVVDDHTLFRRGLISLLADMDDLQVVGEASDGGEALKLVKKLNPDIVLLDINMPVMDGIQTVEALRKMDTPPKIVMFTISQHGDDLISAIRLGADGYLLKNIEPEDLRKALIRVARGEGALSPEVTGVVLKALARQTKTTCKQPISERELEVLNCLALGQTTSQIASKLFISENTVKTHVRHILKKLEASNRTEAVGKAIRQGIIQKRSG